MTLRNGKKENKINTGNLVPSAQAISKDEKVFCVLDLKKYVFGRQKKQKKIKIFVKILSFEVSFFFFESGMEGKEK